MCEVYWNLTPSCTPDIVPNSEKCFVQVCPMSTHNTPAFSLFWVITHYNESYGISNSERHVERL